MNRNNIKKNFDKNSHNKQRRGNRDSQLAFLKDNEFIIEGEAAVAEYLRFSTDKTIKIIADEKVSANLEKLCGGHHPIEWYIPGEWEQQFGELPSKSGVWSVVRLNPIDETDLLAKLSGREKDTIVLLDHVTDPRNLGAIARTCGFFGINEMIAPKNRQVLLTGASVATSQGGFATTDLCVVTNVGRMAEKLKEIGYWILGADMGGEPLEQVAGVYDKVVLVFGNEGKGISEQMLKKCDRVVSIEGSKMGLESLNVSVAAGIVINCFKK